MELLRNRLGLVMLVLMPIFMMSMVGYIVALAPSLVALGVYMTRVTTCFNVEDAVKSGLNIGLLIFWVLFFILCELKGGI